MKIDKTYTLQISANELTIIYTALCRMQSPDCNFVDPGDENIKDSMIDTINNIQRD